MSDQDVYIAAKHYLERLDIYRDVSRRTGSMGRQVQEQPLDDAEKALREAVAAIAQAEGSPPPGREKE